MRILPWFVGIPFALMLMPSEQARACGGCFIGQTETTQVTGHRMVLSVSQEQTTLYDQITYSGDPSEFAWVLPIRGQVEISLSSDALFQTLDQLTAVTINSPSTSCPSSNCFDGNFAGSGGSAAEGGSGPGVEVIAQEVVGPYETVQLAADDPLALETWLDSHGYNVPDEVQPVVDAYVNEGFSFLALRLVPGQGVDSMRPVAVTSPGAAAELPLRMVAAGTGAKTAISLWIVGEGRYKPQNFPSFLISSSELYWDWDVQKSNYADLKEQRFTDSGGTAWLVEAAEPLSPYAFDELVSQASWDPVGSGYADDDGMNAEANATADIARLLTGIDPGSAWVTRISSELSRPALATDLTLQASTDQSVVERTFFLTNTVGTAPTCPPVADCDDDNHDRDPWNPQSPFHRTPSSSSSCSASSSAGADIGLALGAVAVAAALARRKRR